LLKPRQSFRITLYSTRICVLQLRLHDSESFNCLLVDGSEDTTRVVGKESVSGTGSRRKGGKSERDLSFGVGIIIFLILAHSVYKM